jgi:hypothetical protein
MTEEALDAIKARAVVRYADVDSPHDQGGEARDAAASDVLTLVAEVERLRAQDNPALDATDGAHPAWWRGHDYVTERWRERLATAEAERDDLRAENETLRRKIDASASSIKSAEWYEQHKNDEPVPLTELEKARLTLWMNEGIEDHLDAALASVKQRGAMIEGRTVAPTKAEMLAHWSAGGWWLVMDSTGHLHALCVREHGDLFIGARRIVAADRDGRLCAWPEVSRG